MRAFLWLCGFQLICFSPFFLAAQEEPSARILPVAEFQQARAIAVTPLGEIFVLDGALSRLYKLDPTGKKLAHVGGFGIDREAFDMPLDLTTDGLNVFIADRGNQRISQFDRYLNFVTLLQNRPTPLVPFGTISESTNSASQLWRPISVSILGQGDLYILDEAQRQVIRINPLTFAAEIQQRQNPNQFQFGGFDAGAGNLIEPRCLQTSRSGKIFVADVGRNAVVVYDMFGNYVTELGKGWFKALKGLGAGLVPPTVESRPDLQEWLVVVDESALFFFHTEPHTGFKFFGKCLKSDLELLIGSRVSSLSDAAILNETLYLLTENALYLLPLRQLKLVQ
ncbi:MAG: NHL repeat-containing protein [Chloroherpetonaceae bacterium]|nr:NHL repeat-containing protein [Chloroherpetonaceae bacterium]